MHHSEQWGKDNSRIDDPFIMPTTTNQKKQLEEIINHERNGVPSHWKDATQGGDGTASGSRELSLVEICM